MPVPQHSIFYGPDALPDAQPCQSTEGKQKIRKAELFWILMKQQTMRWQWHQLDHMQIICTLLQTDNHTSTSSFSFYKHPEFAHNTQKLLDNQSSANTKLSKCTISTELNTIFQKKFSSKSPHTSILGGVWRPSPDHIH